MGVICFGALGHSNVSVATAVDIDGNVLVLNDLRRLREVDGEGAGLRFDLERLLLCVWEGMARKAIHESGW